MPPKEEVSIKLANFIAHKESAIRQVFSVFMRAAFRVVARFMSLMFKLGPKKDRVRVIIYRDDGDVLLVKNRFSRQEWALSGGGVNRNESYEQAAIREVLEEVGIKIDDLRYLGKANSHESYAKFPVRVFAAQASDYDIKCNFEIMETRWLSREYIPREYHALYVSEH